MSLINITNLTFSYDNNYDNIFENVSFQIDTDWKLGFTGRNGRGKTTFLNLLQGKHEYSGTISSNVDFEYFPYHVENKKISTLEVVNSICDDYQEWEFIRELSLLDVNEDVCSRPFETLSNGEQSKVLFAALFLNQNKFLLIDEPTNHLDIYARAKVSDYLKGKKGYILVSHDRLFLDNCIDHILSINKTNIEIQRGNFSSWMINQERQNSFEIAQNDRLKKDINRLNDASKRTSDWSEKTEKSKKVKTSAGLKPDKGYVGHKSAKMMKRSKTIQARQQAAIEEKSELLLNVEDTNQLKIIHIPYHSKQLLSLENISIIYDKKTACKNVNFTIEQSERIALCGKNGTGKSSIIKLICDENLDFTGKFYKGSNLKISLVSQDASHLTGNLSDFAAQHSIDQSLFNAMLRKLGFSKIQFQKNIDDFSGGQKKKVLVAKSLCERAHLYIWDEPLNFIDVISRIQIENLLLEYQPTILFVEHDQFFSQKVATKTVCLD